jgi:hypothetical protein
MSNSSFQMVILTEWVDPPGIGGILDFFDASVADGSLEGTGWGKWAQARLVALRKMIVAAGEFLEQGLIEEAYFALQDVYDQCQGETTPPDFVRGPATVELSKMILDLMACLGFHET